MLFAKEQSAEVTRALGMAEADAIRAKALADTEGIDKKAEAMMKYGEAAIIEIIMNVMPKIAKNVAQPLSKVDKITMYGEDNKYNYINKDEIEQVVERNTTIDADVAISKDET